MKKLTTIILAGLIIALPLYGCSNNEKDIESAVEVTKTFVEELEKNSFKAVRACYTPDLSEATDILEELEKTGVTSLTDSDSIDFVFDKITKSSLGEKAGEIRSRYNVVFENGQSIKCTFEFEVEKTDGSWYLSEDPEINENKDYMLIALTDSQTIELAIKECMIDIDTGYNSVYNGTTKYIDPLNTERTLPDAITNAKEISVADVAGAKHISEAFKPVIYDGTLYKPYWIMENNVCVFLDSKRNNISENQPDYEDTDKVVPLTDYGIPSENVYIVDFNPFGYSENSEPW
ncbi:MAG: hypothetical protein UD936_08695 [Acutalibacteraceae bacterium]|nr:hypothetical protein [Acutalibacteraceae bacterium]